MKFLNADTIPWELAANLMFQMGATRVACNRDEYVRRGYKGPGIKFPIRDEKNSTYRSVSFVPIPECPRGYIFAIEENQDDELDKAKNRIAELEKKVSDYNARIMELEHKLQSIQDLTKLAL